MNKEKQIEKMAKVIQNVAEKHRGIWCTELAKVIYNAGYRKQSEGEWIVTRTERAWNNAEYPTEFTCSVCGRIQPFAERYCPDCGAKMKGE